MKENLFYSNAKMIKYLRKTKKTNKLATILGLDVGRIFVGSAIADRSFTHTKIDYTYLLRSGNELSFYPKTKDQYNLNLEFFYSINKTIMERKIKGLIIGYPLQNNIPVIIKTLF
jgi:hypothetical protein